MRVSVREGGWIEHHPPQLGQSETVGSRREKGGCFMMSVCEIGN